MKKKQIAVLLAALLSVSLAAEGVAVMGADFSAGEGTSEAVEVQMEKEESTEDASPETEAVMGTGEAEAPDTEEVWISGEDEVSEFETGEEEQQDAFVEEADEELTQSAEVSVSKGTYDVAYITQEQYNKCLDEEDCPDVELKTIEDTTLTEALGKLEGENTGYCLVLPHDVEGAEDIVVPEGLNVYVGFADGMLVKSITPNGNIAFRGIGNGEDNIEIKEGNGTVTFQQLYMTGTLTGTGSDDTVIFSGGDDATLGGISGIENVHFGNDFWNLNIKGKSEFYNLYNDTGSEANDQFPVGIQIEGKDASRTVTFHKTFDWGTGDFSNEEGDHWTAPYTLAIRYYKSFDTNGEEWEMINPGTGFQSVKFNMSDSDIIDMINRVQVHAPEIGYDLDMDGKTWCNENNAVDIEICRSTQELSAQELFDAYGKREHSDEGLSWLDALPSTGQASRYLAAYQKKNNEEGYYIVSVREKAQITGTLTVPDGVNAVKYAGPVQYDEKTDTNRWLPVKISSVNVPAGKKVVLMDMLVNGDNLTITGEGTTELLDTRLNTNVTANTLEITKAAVKKLNCKNLLMEGGEEGGNKLVVARYLSFEKASLNPNCEIYAEPGSYLKLGEIDCTKFDERDNLHIFTGKDGSLSADIYFAGKWKLGTYMHTIWDGSERDLERGMNLITCDEQRARKVNACFTENCFSETYHYNEDEKSWWGDYPVVYKKEAICLATIDKKLDEKEILELLSVEVALSEKEDSSVILSVPEKENGEWEDYAIDGDKRLTNYWHNENDEWKQIKTKAYFKTANAPATSISSAKISDIKTQIYAGKAVTPSVTVTLNGKKLKAGTDYTVSYTNNTKAGATATVTVIGKGNYTGAVTQNFKIAAVPAKSKVYTVGNLKYKVTKSAYKNGTVSVSAPAKKTLTSVSVPATVKIGGYTFNVTAIGDKAFNDCTKLKKVTIGSKVTTIGKQAFNGCKVLTSITISSKVLKTVGSSALKGISAKAVIKVPAAKLTAYQKLLKGKGQKASVKIRK